MDIIIIIVGTMIVLLLIVVIVLLLRKSSNGSAEQADFKAMEERLIRVEGEVGKINPAIDRNFRENRKEGIYH